MTKCSLSAQISVNNFLSHVLAGSSPGSLASMAGVLAYNLHGLDPDAARVRDGYLPNIRPAFERLKADEPLTSAEHASLILGLITFWNALSCLPGGLPPPVVSKKVVTQRLEALGLGRDAPLLSRSVLTRKPSEFALQVRLERDIGPVWFRQVLKESRLWNEGATGASAAALYEFMLHLERDSAESYFGRTIDLIKPFKNFAQEVQGSRKPRPLPPALKEFLLGDAFVDRALFRDPRKRRELIGFLELAHLNPWDIPSVNFGRFPSFEAFQAGEGDYPYNNFTLHFFPVPEEGAETNVYRTERPVFTEFQKRHPDLEATLSGYFPRRQRNKPVERLLYEAYRLMAAMPEAGSVSLII